jgi:tetratricopeptide (TPR) repeat protein
MHYLLKSFQRKNMNNFYKLTCYKFYLYLTLIVFLIYGCGNKESTPVTDLSEATVKEEEKEKAALTLPNLGSSDAEGYYNFGVDIIKKGDFDLAIQAWNKAVEIDPTMVKALNYLGRAYYTQGMMDEAITAYEKAVKLDSGNPDSYINLGIAYRYNGMIDEAIAEYNKAIELNPFSAIAFDEIGNALAKKEKYDEAIKAYKQAITFDPEYPQPHNHLGVVYLLKGMSKEASAEFKLFEKLEAAKKAKLPKGLQH